ncbi:tryptophanase [Halorubellus sp. JP-L1]|uniref:tryptophanase n=1 Tax=Halorubellus sp. JP-L1 TaxID=2715753 RepID=UPI001409A7FF|nr:tryptophanase [Halorubellus sp. JP-L1]NHN43438.1 tryptophanase [Halorubellus sp. JP-L1]
MVRYKSKMVERIHLPAREERERNLADAGYNVFNLDARDVFVDLLTDSGTGTMTDSQWAALMRGDEAYAGSRSFEELESAVADVMGFEHVVPAHQGRGAENVLYSALLDSGDVALNNTHFDTTRAHVANQGADAVDCPVDEAHDPDADADFKGNFSVEKAREYVDEHGADSVPVVILTITNNSAAGQPVSVENTRRAANFADEIDATFVLDACRFAENAYFVTEREDEYADATVAAVAREQLSYADAIVMSGKKDGLVNIGGFVATDDDALYEQTKQLGILYEGFPTYGGMAGRDVAAMAVGLREAVEPGYTEDRVGQVQALGEALAARGIPVFEPIGGHAVYLEANAFLPHLDREEFPGQSLVCELYREGGVRAVELGELAFPAADRPELVRMAVPRRTYHREHVEHVVDTVAAVHDRRDDVTGLEIVDEPEMAEIRHFTAELQPVE